MLLHPPRKSLCWGCGLRLRCVSGHDGGLLSVVKFSLRMGVSVCPGIGTNTSVHTRHECGCNAAILGCGDWSDENGTVCVVDNVNK